MLDSYFSAKVGDFGLGKLVDHEKETLADTMRYMAPRVGVHHLLSCQVLGETIPCVQVRVMTQTQPSSPLHLQHPLSPMYNN